ncbi:MAG: bifunctional diaminohydroxyphosphoribosylaminopyrimidine deaminase/5-amino-6-(5-phosphoribosylamino)uracil reductase RibD [Bacteroidales bacterium]|nr:bifunctional diaminohydroxyphosphoribosylaminopyrimidine deaminase/5-amino-6-(5-phosphoribosylamino)uracil reductase RibD [Bacteroidales bacterium]
MKIEERYMRRALELAKKGFPNVSPNPMVGAVIVSADGRILGEGYHRKVGEAHAEVNAINSVVDREALADSTMYVTLEPCCHYGRTGPCADLIIATDIPRVVVGTRDPFDKVNGAGIERLMTAGVEVEVGILEKECRSLNAVFFTAHTLHRPFVMLKWAQSADGFLDVKRTPDQPAAQISTPLTRMLTHRLRATVDAIMVGSGTVLADNPRLDCRLWPGTSPRPIILDRRRRVKGDYKVLGRDPMIITEDLTLPDLLLRLYDQGITSLLVEGGAQVLSWFLSERIWDLARVEIGPVAFGNQGGVVAPPIWGVEPIQIFDIEGQNVKYYSQNPLFDVKNL